MTAVSGEPGPAPALWFAANQPYRGPRASVSDFLASPFLGAASLQSDTVLKSKQLGWRAQPLTLVPTQGTSSSTHSCLVPRR